MSFNFGNTTQQPSLGFGATPAKSKQNTIFSKVKLTFYCVTFSKYKL